MKKIFLLCGLICASQMYCMEPEKPQSVEFGEEWKTLPDDIKPLILIAFMESGNDLDTAIENIKIASLTNKALNQMINLNNLQGFTKIVHMLANKFNISSRSIANKFHTPTSKKYAQILWHADNWAGEPRGQKITDEINSLMEEGLDVNAIYSNGQSLLQRIILDRRGLDLINLLLNAGANPHHKDNKGYTALDYAKKQYSEGIGTTPLDRYNFIEYKPVLEKIIPVLEEAMQNYQQ